MSTFYSGVYEINELERLYGLMNDQKELVLGFHFIETENSRKGRLWYQSILDGTNEEEKYILEENGHEYFTCHFSYGLKFVDKEKEYSIWIHPSDWLSEEEDGELVGGYDWFFEFREPVDEETVDKIFAHMESEKELLHDLGHKYHVDLENLQVAIRRD